MEIAGKENRQRSILLIKVITGDGKHTPV